MEAKELRKKKEELESKIKVLVDEFVQEVGMCNIGISISVVSAHSLYGGSIYTGSLYGGSIYTGSKVEIRVTI